jgi:hypothetical protein
MFQTIGSQLDVVAGSIHDATSCLLIYMIFPAALWVWGLLRLKQNEYLNFPEDKGQTVHKADILTAICDTFA